MIDVDVKLILGNVLKERFLKRLCTLWQKTKISKLESHWMFSGKIVNV